MYLSYFFLLCFQGICWQLEFLLCVNCQIGAFQLSLVILSERGCNEIHEGEMNSSLYK